MLIAILAVVWWTFAVVAMSFMINLADMRSNREKLMTIAVSVFWPIIAVGMVPAIIYTATVKSTAQIRADLRNRKVLREFETWLAEHNSK